jgi:hypothetical protein
MYARRSFTKIKLLLRRNYIMSYKVNSSYKVNLDLELYLRTTLSEEDAQKLLNECIDEITDLFLTKQEIVGIRNNDSTVEEIIVDDSLWGDSVAKYEPYDPEQ